MMTYEYDPVNSIIHLHATGILVASDPINYFKRIDNDPVFQPPAEELVYLVGLDDITWRYSDIFRIREAFESYNHGSKISSGKFIVDSDLSYGMARMVIAIFDTVFEKFTIERRG